MKTFENSLDALDLPKKGFLLSPHTVRPIQLRWITGVRDGLGWGSLARGGTVNISANNWLMND